jgi:GNAT superfamily N-acetyltransferase
MMFITRPWQPHDVPFLWDMLYESIHLRDGQAPPPRSIVEEPGLAHYLVAFGREGDDAQIAISGVSGVSGVRGVRGVRGGSGEEGARPIGAAWCRRMSADDPGYGFVDDDIPELGTAVVAEWRGRGVGTRLIRELMGRNPTMSLSVDDDNDRAKALYERLGFIDVGGEGTARTMLHRADIPPAKPRGATGPSR